MDQKEFEDPPTQEEIKETQEVKPIPDELKPDLEIITKLKELCDQLVNSSKVSKHLNSKAKLFKVLPKEGEQSLKQFQSYMTLLEIIEPQIEHFLEAKGLDEEKVYESIQKVAAFDEQYLKEIEVLIAATDYEVFSKLMNQIYKSELV